MFSSSLDELDDLPLGVFALRADRTIATWNCTMESWSGFAVEKAIGRTLSDCFPDYQETRCLPRLDDVFEAGTPLILSAQLQRQVLPLKLTDGRARIQQGSVTAIRAGRNRERQALFVIHDVTALADQLAESNDMGRRAVEAQRVAERQAKELAAAKAELEQLNALASHDLREPLRTLTSYSELLKGDLGDGLSPNVSEDIGFIMDAARRMEVMINDLLSLSRAGLSEMKLEDVDLGECLADSLTALRSRLDESQARIERGALPHAKGDRVLLTQLFQNLLSNAIKFRRKGAQPVIDVSAERVDGEWVVAVRDDGIGIGAESLDEIFKPFHRLNGMSDFDGSGIGLAFCKKTVERHGGRIWAESTPGEGASLLFTLGVDCRTGAAPASPEVTAQ